MALVLITGVAGFIGSHLAEALRARGDRVLGVDNFEPFYARAVKEANLSGLVGRPGFEFVEADLRRREDMQELLRRRPDAVVHLAARAGVRPSLLDPAGYVETNVAGTAHLLEACREQPPRHFVFASSSSVYGDRARVPFSEDDATDEPASPYAATKKAGEVLCFTYHRLLPMPVTCLRFFTVIGPRQRPDLAINKFVRLIEAGEPLPFFGDGSTSRDYTYVGDTVQGILAALGRPDGYRIFNLGRSDPVTLAEMVATLERVVGKPAILERLPEQPGDVRITCADTSRAERELGYRPTVGFEEGVRRFVEWRRAEAGHQSVL